MANQISGKVLILENAVTIPTRTGNTFTKRQIVLDASHYDPMTGQKFENYPAFDFIGNRVNDLDSFKEGDLVTISFALNGRPFEKDGKTIYITSVTGYKIEPYQRQNNGYKPSNSTHPTTTHPTTTPPTNPQAQPHAQNMPQQTSQTFPPNVDENGRPRNEDDLPF